MKVISVALLAVLVLGCNTGGNPDEQRQSLMKNDVNILEYTLPAPVLTGKVSVEEALASRRSHRHFTNESISAEDLSQLLWAAYGITWPLSGYPLTQGGLRTAPSAGALYPLKIYVLAGRVKGIEPGVYRYSSREHKLTMAIDHDVREQLSVAALRQEMIKTAPAVIFYSADFSLNTVKYGDRGRERYVCMDLGHSAENVYMQAEALHLGTCAIGAFNDEAVRNIMQLPENEEPLYIMPVGQYYHKTEF
ncbi:MAG: SagB/ThcOx family dehydrogenase [Bacteroidales bacterium]|nr:SagB/ThcOx family dehydrogenase [Bacteroidales bacterium]